MNGSRSDQRPEAGGQSFDPLFDAIGEALPMVIPAAFQLARNVRIDPEGVSPRPPPPPPPPPPRGGGGGPRGGPPTLPAPPLERGGVRTSPADPLSGGGEG